MTELKIFYAFNIFSNIEIWQVSVIPIHNSVLCSTALPTSTYHFAIEGNKDLIFNSAKMMK